MGEVAKKNEVGTDVPKKSLTQRDIPNLPIGTYQIERGLYVRKGKRGGHYFYRVQVDGERHDVGLGAIDAIKLADVKDKAMMIRADVLNGKKPWAQDESGVTFAEYWEKAFETYADTRTWKRESQHSVAISLIRRCALPTLGKRMLKAIDRDDVLAVLKPLWKEKPITANRLRIHLGKVFDLAVIQGIMKTNPAAWEGNLSYFLPPVSAVHRAGHWAALSFEETRTLLWKLRLSEYATHRLIVMLILTARRLSEALNAKWEYIDLDSAVWIVPDENMKVQRHTDRRVPLPRQLVEEMRAWPRNSEWVFSADGRKRLSIDGVLKPLKRQSGKDVTIHGFRSTFTDWAAENGVSMEVAEKCLDHETGTKVRRAYQRSDLFELRREALQRYADAMYAE